MILITFFCNLKTLEILVELPQKIIPYLMTEWKLEKYTIHRVFKLSWLQKWQLNMGRIYSSWLFQFILLSICIPKNFITGTSFITKLPKDTANKGLADCLGAKLIIFVLLIFKTYLLAVNQFAMRDKVPVTLCLRAQ
jgi:hypothetical protein